MSHFRLNASVVTSAQRTGKLDLHGRSLYTVPADVFNAAAFGSLAVLDLSENKLAELPGDIRQLQSLREIYLDNNSLSTLPTELQAKIFEPTPPGARKVVLGQWTDDAHTGFWVLLWINCARFRTALNTFD